MFFVLTILVAFSHLTLGYDIFCVKPDVYHCDFYFVNIPAKNPNYTIKASNPNPNPASSSTWITISESKFGRITKEFGLTFPGLIMFQATGQGIEIIDVDAFANCANLQTIEVPNNAIKILPSMVFATNPRLTHLQLQNNQIQLIYDNQFEHQEALFYLELSNNSIKSFPASAVQNCKNLWSVRLAANDLADLNVNGLDRSNLPALQYFYYNHNLFTCSRLQAIIETLPYIGHYQDSARKCRDFDMCSFDISNVRYVCMDPRCPTLRVVPAKAYCS